MDLNKWSTVDIKYRGVFKTLEKVPRFVRGVYQDGPRDGIVPDEKIEESGRFQGHVVYALLSDILESENVSTRHGMAKKEGFSLRYVSVVGRLGLAC